MRHGQLHRYAWLAVTAGLVLALLWLDQTRGGPATTLSRCNLLLSRRDAPAADVLIVGSSRSGTALDPISMQQMLRAGGAGGAVTVERLALGQSPLRASTALLENYFNVRGAPRVVALELMFDTQRTIDRLQRRGLDEPPEQYIFRRDLNLMRFAQILTLPAVSMPFSETEGTLNLWRFRLRGAVLRAGALTYEFLRHPRADWSLSSCDRDAWTREPEWPAEFAFSFGENAVDEPPAVVIDALEMVMSDRAATRALKPWQTDIAPDQTYPYDFDSPYRQGEMTLLREMIALATEHDSSVVLLPLPLYGQAPGTADMHALTEMLPPRTHVFNLYAEVRGDLSKFWYDDAHLELYPAGALTTAILAEHLIEADLLSATPTGTADD